MCGEEQNNNADATDLSIVADQVNSAMVGNHNTARLLLQTEDCARQDRAYALATAQVDKVRDFISKPENILGNDLTKHGEIAEQMEVGIRNARQAMEWQAETELDFRATFDGVGRTAPEDYLIDGEQVQSKFINGEKNTVNHVLGHMDKYRSFQEDGYYHVPKDQYDNMFRIRNGEAVPELSLRKQESIRRAIEEIEQRSGKPFDEVVKPALHDYGEVQRGVAERTLDGHEQDIEDADRTKRSEIEQAHAPSLKEGLQVTAKAAAFAGAATLGVGLYRKYRQGKNVFRGELNGEDWRELGVATAKGAALGGVAAGSVYLLTNYAGMAAPYAGAVASALRGVGALAVQFGNGQIGFDEFCELGMLLCSESAATAIASVLGQAAIPIPLLGAAIGSIAGKLLMEGAKSLSGRIDAKLKADMMAFRQRLSEVERRALDRINRELDTLGALTIEAFKPQNNIALLHLSVQLSEAYGVEDSKIIRSQTDLDTFMLG